ncbi:MAG: hypothetical protein HY291_15880 [Planctomycetes bacterium]|nr:hypothetical protein [Planctomycetota bacterium]
MSTAPGSEARKSNMWFRFSLQTLLRLVLIILSTLLLIRAVLMPSWVEILRIHDPEPCLELPSLSFSSDGKFLAVENEFRLSRDSRIAQDEKWTVENYVYGTCIRDSDTGTETQFIPAGKNLPNGFVAIRQVDNHILSIIPSKHWDLESTLEIREVLDETSTGILEQLFQSEDIYFNDYVFAPDGNKIAASFMNQNRECTTLVWRRLRPEKWWGITYLPAFWLSVLLPVALAFSIRRDRRSLKASGTV